MNLIWGHSQKCWHICQILASYLFKSVRTLKALKILTFQLLQIRQRVTSVLNSDCGICSKRSSLVEGAVSGQICTTKVMMMNLMMIMVMVMVIIVMVIMMIVMVLIVGTKALVVGIFSAL